MGLLDNEKQNQGIRTTGIVYLEYLIFGMNFILLNLFLIRVFFSEKTLWDLLGLVFFAIFIPMIFIWGWRRKMIAYSENKIKNKDLQKNFWSSRISFAAIIIFVWGALLQGIVSNYLHPISKFRILIILFVIVSILLHLGYAFVTGLLLKKINKVESIEK